MRDRRIDMLIVLASQGSKTAYEELYRWFIDVGKIVILTIAKQENISHFNIDDLKNDLDELFLITVSTFAFGGAPFDKYAYFILKKRCKRLLIDHVYSKNNTYESLDNVSNDGFCLYDVLESEDYSKMNEDLYRDSNRQFIASHRLKSTKMDEKIRRFLELKEKGYKKQQILKIMKLKDGQYRYLIRIIADIERGNIKIAMK